MRDLIRIVENAAPASVKFEPDPTSSSRWDVLLGDEKIGTIRKTFSGARRGVNRAVGYEVSVRVGGKLFRDSHPKLNDLKAAVKAFVSANATPA